MIEYERVLVDVFGEDWQMRLAAAGIVGGETAADEDRQRVIALAGEVRPDLDEDRRGRVGDAWYEWWCCAQSGDRQGNNLRPGDACILFRGSVGVGVTVLRVLDDGLHYLVQMDPRDPASSPAVVAVRDQLDAMASGAGVDVQEPFVVAGSELELFWDDEDP